MTRRYCIPRPFTLSIGAAFVRRRTVPVATPLSRSMPIPHHRVGQPLVHLDSDKDKYRHVRARLVHETPAGVSGCTTRRVGRSTPPRCPAASAPLSFSKVKRTPSRGESSRLVVGIVPNSRNQFALKRKEETMKSKSIARGVHHWPNAIGQCNFLFPDDAITLRFQFERSP